MRTQPTCRIKAKEVGQMSWNDDWVGVNEDESCYVGIFYMWIFETFHSLHYWPLSSAKILFYIGTLYVRRFFSNFPDRCHLEGGTRPNSMISWVGDIISAYWLMILSLPSPRFFQTYKSNWVHCFVDEISGLPSSNIANELFRSELFASVRWLCNIEERQRLIFF